MVRRVLDFRIWGLPHSEVKKAEQDRVRKLINKIESHPDQGDLQEDLKHTNVFDPCCENSSKTWIRETGNVEYFVLCETDSRVQCSYCLSCWVKGLVNCNCGICLSHTDEMRPMNTKRFDTLSIVGYVIKKGVGHGARHGKSEAQLFYHKSFHVWNRWGRHKGESGECFAGILDRFQRDPVYRESQEVHGWTEALCKEMERESAGRPHVQTNARRTCTVQIELGHGIGHFRKQCANWRIQIRGIHEWAALRRVQELRIDEFLKKKIDRWSKFYGGTHWKIQELQNENNCMNDSRGAESVCSGPLSHVVSELALFPLPTYSGGLLSRPQNSQHDIRNTHRISGNVFANSHA